MLNRAGESTFKQQMVRHLVHHGGEDSNIGQQDVGGTNRGVKGHFVDKILECRIVVIQHVKVHVEQTVVGFHIHSVKVDAV